MAPLERNAYYSDSEPLESETRIRESSAIAANMQKFCVTLQGYTDLQEKRFPSAVRTGDSPQGDSAGFVL